MAGWFLSNSWMHPDFRKPMKAVLIVVAINSALLITGGVAISSWHDYNLAAALAHR